MNQTDASVSKLPPWNDGVRELWKVFHPARVERWERVYMSRLQGKPMSEIGDEHNLQKEEVRLIVCTVARSLRCWERNNA